MRPNTGIVVPDNVMLKKLALALVTLGILAPSANALPPCYMESNSGAIVDLSHMCGSVGGQGPSIAAIEAPTVLGGESLPELSVDQLATFTLLSADYYPLVGDTVFDVRVEFSRSAVIGTSVTPYIDQYTFEPIVRERSRRDKWFSVRVPGEHTLSGIGSDYGLVEMSQEAISAGLGRSTR